MTTDAANQQWPQGYGYLTGDKGTDALGRKVTVEAVPDQIIDTEDFEGGVAGTGTWTITTSNPHTGINCLRSAVIGNNQQTNQVFNIPVGATHLRFWHRVSSEQNFDFFRVLVDAVQVFQLSGTANIWQQLTVPLGAATTVTFRYIKDSSVIEGLDAAFIDDLEWFIPGVQAVEAHEPFHLNIDNEVLVHDEVASTGLTNIETAINTFAAANDSNLDDVNIELDDITAAILAFAAQNDSNLDAINTELDAQSIVLFTIQTILGSGVSGTLNNGAQVSTAGAGAVSILAANTNRKWALIQNVGIATCRIGVTGVTATTGIRLQPGDSLTFQMPFCPDEQLFMIREGAVNAIVLVQEVTT